MTREVTARTPSEMRAKLRQELGLPARASNRPEDRALIDRYYTIKVYGRQGLLVATPRPEMMGDEIKRLREENARLREEK